MIKDIQMSITIDEQAFHVKMGQITRLHVNTQKKLYAMLPLSLPESGICAGKRFNSRNCSEI